MSRARHLRTSGCSPCVDLGLTSKWSRRARCPVPSCRSGARLIWRVRRTLTLRGGDWMGTADENFREIYRALRDAQNRYTYFLLAAAGGAIGFAVTQTRDASLNWTHSLLGCAGLAWGFSFYFGCRHLAYISSSLYAKAAAGGGRGAPRCRPASAAHGGRESGHTQGHRI